jgi:hypothetical protein
MLIGVLVLSCICADDSLSQALECRQITGTLTARSAVVAVALSSVTAIVNR